MKKNTLLFFLVLVVFLGNYTEPISAITFQQEPDLVYVIGVDGTIELGLSQFVLRGLKQAERNNAAVLLEINTFGGRVDAAAEIRDYIFRMEVPVIAFVRERAISAGAFITLAAPHIAMAPGSSIGAAQPSPTDEKTVAALRAELESTAERYGRDPKLAGAMVDADVSIEGLVDKGKILSLRATQALEYGYADIVADSRETVLEFFNLEGLEVVEIEPNWAERVVGFITDPTISQLLLTLGFLGLTIEVATAGWGVPGTAGLIAMGLFFGGRMLTGLVGFEVVALFALGLVLLALEIFVIPGFGIAGILGLISLFASIVLSYGSFYSALYSIAIAVLITIVVIVVFWRKFRKSKAWGRFVLVNEEDKLMKPGQGIQNKSELIGKTGLTVTPLRPAGIALIDNKRHDVVSEGSFIASNTQIEVVEIEGYRIVVRELTN